MGDHPNVALVRGLIDAFNSMDVEAIGSTLADDVTWHMIGGDTVVGREALGSAMGAGERDFTVTTQLHDVVGNDKHVIALVEASARAGDREFEYRTAEIMHVEDGKVTERWAFSDDTQAINEFFGQFG